MCFKIDRLEQKCLLFSLFRDYRVNAQALVDLLPPRVKSNENGLIRSLCGAWIKLCVGRASEADRSELAHTFASSGISGA